MTAKETGLANQNAGFTTFLTRGCQNDIDRSSSDRVSRAVPGKSAAAGLAAKRRPAAQMFASGVRLLD